MIEIFAALFAFVCFVIEMFLLWTIYWVCQQTGALTLPVAVWGFIVILMIGIFHSERLDA